MNRDIEDNTRLALEDLKALGLEAEIIPHETSGKATEDAATILDVKPELILKMMILVDKRTMKSAGVLLRGNERIDQKKLRAATGLKTLRFAAPEEVKDITGYAIGGVPPTAICKCHHRMISDSILDADFVYGSGGSELCAMKISPAQLQRLSGVTFAAVAQLLA